jgi:hydroxymethylpyrimidine/phosphomethylpyrimidine kinase
MSPASRATVVLSIAGSDPSGGAGIQADLKTFSALGVYGCAVITALTAQSTTGVTGVLPIPAAFVTQQIDTLFADVHVDAVKIGMLADAEIVRAVAEALDRHQPAVVVLDPVMVATSGDRLLAAAAEEAMRAELMPRADIITPNLAEAAVLLGCEPATRVDEGREQVGALLRLGARRVLLKGGHFPGASERGGAIDLLGGLGISTLELDEPWIQTVNTHGTGCTLSSALAALRPARAADDPSWVKTTQDARSYLTTALRGADALQIGHGHGPVSHFASWPSWGDTSR